MLSGGGSSQVRSVGGAPIEIPLTSGAAASFARITYHASSPLNAIREVAPQATVTFTPGDDLEASRKAAAAADMVVVFATKWSTEAVDSENMDLEADQNALIATAAQANPKTVVVLETGGPVLMPWIEQVPAVVQAWYPGQRGGEAIAGILFGEINPSGRLPITFPATADQPPRPIPPGLDLLKAADSAAADAAANPGAPPAPGMADFAVDYVEGADAGYRWYDRRGLKPLFPFGHGLSYTTFAYDDLTVSNTDGLSVSFNVTNAGRVAGADVPQLYVRPAEGDQPRRLAGWSKLTLQPGETRRVTIKAEPRILAEYDTGLPGWRIAEGAYAIAVAKDAEDGGLRGEITISGSTMRP